MVATTTTFHLPYQQGTDPPCFGPGAGCTHLNSVWCDFVALVETQMDVVDGVVGRTATVIPMAKITFLRNSQETLVVDPLDRLPFDTVVFDTDDMVDFSVSPGAITPKRNGIYQINFWCLFQQTVLNDLHEFSISIGSEVEPSTSGSNHVTVATATTVSAQPLLNTFMRASTQYQFVDVTTPRAVTVSTNQSPSIPPTIFGALEMFWHSDL